MSTDFKDFKPRFLAVLELSESPPSLNYLEKLIERHKQVVPYESDSKLVQKLENKVRLQTPHEYLEGIETKGQGSTCYAINYYFHMLLTKLGFNSQVVACETKGVRRGHLSLRVCLDGQNYAIDFGLMAPSPGPFSLEGNPIKMQKGSQLFEFIPRGDGKSHRFVISRNGVVGRDFVTMPGTAKIEDFQQAIIESFSPGSLFMKTLCISRWCGSTYRSVWNREYWENEGNEAFKEEISDVEALALILKRQFQFDCSKIKEVIRLVEVNCGESFFD